MNILVLTSVYPQPDDGKNKSTYTVQYFCEKWVEQGHNVKVFQNSSRFPVVYYWGAHFLGEHLASKLGHNMPTAQSKISLDRNEKGVDIFRRPILKVIPHGNFSKKVLKTQAELIIRELEQLAFSPEVIISHWANPQIPLMQVLKKKYNAKCSIVFHNDCDERTIKNLRLHETIKDIDAIGCRSNTYAEYVKDTLYLDKKPFVCYSGVPDEMVDKYNNMNELSKKKKNTFLYVGRLVRYKNINTILEALYKAFPSKDFKLYIVGDGAELENLQKAAETLSIEEQVEFLGKMPRNDIFELMRSVDCFTMVSDNETFGMVYIEAMLMGCVTIASKFGGVDGVIVNGKNGFLCEQGNSDELASIYCKLSEMSDDEITLIRKNAINTAKEFADSKVSNKYLKDVMEW